ncbi:MAG TPA: LysM domain-containing protein, partial [Solirubrobacterales bacterium]|nr:LysM domain-containing protein [Solirubrobacterales bacterium]
VPLGGGDAGGSLAGRSFHVVRPGESLWSIARAMLPAGASNAAIAREVRKLWRLNAARIGTGDPSLLMVGTRLRLR